MKTPRCTGFVAALGAALLSAGCATPPAPAAPAATSFFDDFSYTSTAGLTRTGWKLRSADGHPGVPGGHWRADAVSLVDDTTQPGNRLLRLHASTDGTAGGTVQAQVCQARKFLRGTYAARVHFADAPLAGSDGDPIIQTFYAVSPLAHAFDPDFSEVDWEYLANGGWGSPATRLYGISWQTVQIEPWQAHNSAHEELQSFAGWHVLLMQVEAAQVRMFVDGRLVAQHSGRNVPVSAMAINFNLWFSPGGLLPAGGAPREYVQDVDWVFHAAERTLSPAEVGAAVAAWRHAGVTHIDSVAPARPALVSSCDF